MKITQITPGKHKVEVRRPPYQPWVYDLDAQPEQVLKLNGKLLPAEVAVKITSEPRGEVFLVQDGKRDRKGQVPVNLKLNPKYAYVVVVAKEGYKEWSQPINFEGDAPIKIKAELEKSPKGEIARPEPTPRPKAKPRPRPHPRPKTAVTPRPRPQPRPQPQPKPRPQPTPAPEPTGTGTLLIGSNPWTHIIIDGKDTGLTTPKRIPLPSGRHRVTLRNPKFGVNTSFTVMIKANTQTKVIKKNLAP